MGPKDNILVRDASLKDIPIIRELAGRVYMQTYRGIHSDEQNAYMFEMMYSEQSLVRQMAEEGSRFLLVSVGGMPAGYCAYKTQPEAVVYLDKLYVLPENQGMGLGKTLMEVVISRARDTFPQGCTVRLDVNRSNRAMKFYVRMGFTAVRDYDAPIGKGFFMNATTMELVLG